MSVNTLLEENEIQEQRQRIMLDVWIRKSMALGLESMKRVSSDFLLRAVGIYFGQSDTYTLF